MLTPGLATPQPAGASVSAIHLLAGDHQPALVPIHARVVTIESALTTVLDNPLSIGVASRVRGGCDNALFVSLPIVRPATFDPHPTPVPL